MELFFGFGLAFLALLAVLGLGLLRVLRGKDGQSAPRMLTGCAALGGLGCLGFVAFLVFVALMTVFTGVAIVEEGPIRELEIIRSDDGYDFRPATTERPYELEAEYDAHVLVKYRGSLDPRKVQNWLERETRGDVALLDSRPVNDDGELLELFDFGVKLSRHDRRNLEELDLALPFDLPQGLRVEIK